MKALNSYFFPDSNTVAFTRIKLHDKRIVSGFLYPPPPNYVIFFKYNYSLSLAWAELSSSTPKDFKMKVL